MMNAGDMVYYLYTGKDGTPIKFAAVVLALESDGILIRVGKFDVSTQEVKTFESVVAETSLESRSVRGQYSKEFSALIDSPRITDRVSDLR
jgi:hypothetical protein